MTTSAIAVFQDRSQDPKIRMDALLNVLEDFQEPYFTILETILNDDSEHPDVRSATALALGHVGGERSLAILLPHVESGDITVKNYSIQALGRLHRVEVVPVLIDQLTNPNNEIFNSVAEALGNTGELASAELIHLLESPGADDARCVAAWKLGEMRCEESIPALIQVIRSENNADILALCLWALGEIGVATEEVFSTLAWAKNHESPDVYMRASRAMKKIARHHN